MSPQHTSIQWNIFDLTHFGSFNRFSMIIEASLRASLETWAVMAPVWLLGQLYIARESRKEGCVDSTGAIIAKSDDRAGDVLYMGVAGLAEYSCLCVLSVYRTFLVSSIWEASMDSHSSKTTSS